MRDTDLFNGTPRQSKAKPGFTLIELLLAIGIIVILAAVVIVAINPSRQLRQANDATRRSFSNELQKSVVQYVIDNRGDFPEDDKILEDRDWGVDVCIPGTGAHIDCVNLDDELLPNYLADFVIDPAEKCPYKIGYFIYRAHGRPLAEPRHLGKLGGDAVVRDCVESWTWSAGLATQGNGDSLDPAVAGNGQYVFFDSDATNLVSGDTNGVRDVFLYDTDADSTERVSLTTASAQGNGGSFQASASADGRFIAFLTDATNLVASDTNGARDVLVRDRSAGTTELVSANTSGDVGNNLSAPFASPPSISADGRYIAFDSRASDLVASDTNSADDIFVRDRIGGTTVRVSVSDAGVQGNGGSNAPSISADGRFIAFQSTATNLAPNDTNGVTDIFVHDRDTDQDGIFDEAGGIRTEHVSFGVGGALGNSDSLAASISGDGRYVVFLSVATNLVSGDSNGLRDVFLRDRTLYTTRRVNVSTADVQSNGLSYAPTISRNGRYILFDSAATNLVSGDTNGVRDLFLRDRRWAVTQRISASAPGQQASGESQGGAISDEGNLAVFFASDSVTGGDTNGVLDVYVLPLEL